MGESAQFPQIDEKGWRERERKGKGGILAKGGGDSLSPPAVLLGSGTRVFFSAQQGDTVFFRPLTLKVLFFGTPLPVLRSVSVVQTGTVKKKTKHNYSLGWWECQKLGGAENNTECTGSDSYLVPRLSLEEVSLVGADKDFSDWSFLPFPTQRNETSIKN